ncbi:MAG: hypothetical protein WD696_14310 [Bryobacteraceae bacterium]
MTIVLWTAIPSFVLLAVAFALLFWKLAARQQAVPVNLDGLERISSEKYLPMGRLLREDDFRFLAGFPGLSSRVARQLRADRRQIFRGYLRCLKRDFARVDAGIKWLVLTSSCDRPDLAVFVFKQRVTFMAALLAVEYHLLLHAAGIGTVNIQSILQPLEALRFEFQQMLSAPLAAGAAA